MNEETGREENKPDDAGDSSAADAGTSASESGREARQEAESGPTFTESPDPLAGVRRWLGGIMASMDGKSVSMKTYVGTVIGVVVLMMLARCGG